MQEGGRLFSRMSSCLILMAALLLLLRIQSSAASDPKLEYLLVNETTRIPEPLRGIISFDSNQRMVFTMKGEANSIEGHLISLKNGNLEMTMKPIDLKAERGGEQMLSFYLRHGTADFDFYWKQYTDDGNVLFLTVSNKKRLGIADDKTVVINYDHAGNFTAFLHPQNNQLTFGETAMLQELKGLEAVDGQQLLNFSLEWKEQTVDFNLIFGEGVYFAIPCLRQDESTTQAFASDNLPLVYSTSTEPPKENFVNNYFVYIITGISFGSLLMGIILGMVTFVYFNFYRSPPPYITNDEESERLLSESSSVSLSTSTTTTTTTESSTMSSSEVLESQSSMFDSEVADSSCESTESEDLDSQLIE